MTDEEIKAFEAAAGVAVRIVEAVIYKIIDAKAGKLSASEVLQQMTSLHDLVTGNQAAADAAIDARFSGKSTDESKP